MNLHTLKNVSGARRRRIRVGRGKAAGRGKTGGRGQKGQMSRKGHKDKLGFEGGQMRLVRRIPKRGFKNPLRKVWAVVNLDELSRFEDGAEVTPKILRDTRVIKGPADGVKVLGRGELSKKLIVRAQAFSNVARARIEAAGGTCEVVAD